MNKIKEKILTIIKEVNTDFSSEKLNLNDNMFLYKYQISHTDMAYIFLKIKNHFNINLNDLVVEFDKSTTFKNLIYSIHKLTYKYES